ncbi:hypothetical protein [Bradyrhizobium sp. CW1]|uniref:hypothetical protein n=1 Tax=Bradyrhizobium sp. CW1 TaxID=2782686 RepID=UPI001FFF1257|nr:hypothetical protein [Bradyrhizobium sp. CW1]
MKIGVQKEIKRHEYRVGLTPGAVRDYVAVGHSVLIRTNAGAEVGATDENYRQPGATILGSAREVFAASEMIVRLRSRGFRMEPTARETDSIRVAAFGSRFGPG